MKRLINIFSIILLLSFSINTTITTAQVTSPKSLGQGIYSVRDANLLVGTRINVHITPANAKAIILVIDSDHTIEALVRLNTKITEQTLPPLNYDSSLIIFTNGSVVLS
ncbi:hypothetical protein ACN077_09130 [Clostridium chromiireducens]|uniref:Uncharacterized protein n=1 Tax=Clostridium chromiireducens TaxID=225345 RepID=A0A964RMG6_9CLOT|nr:hypothetical protein [Clostridium chromiireducens]MVX64308.1 hypothetical protein [Clostridium chromiireducens]